MMSNSFYSEDELTDLGLKSFGKHVLISRKASIYGPENISIGNHVRIDDFCILSDKISIGNYIHIAAYTAIYGKFGVELFDYVAISAKCILYSASDDFSGRYFISPTVQEPFTNVTGGKVIIKPFSVVGAGSIIMPNLTIQEGVAVGSMSLVKNSLEEWNIYAGNPIRLIKKRDRGVLDLYGKHRTEL